MALGAAFSRLARVDWRAYLKARHASRRGKAATPALQREALALLRTNTAQSAEFL